jgi:hypothetical protein
MSARVTPNIRLPNTRRERNLSLLREEEDTTTNKRDSEVRRSQSLRRRPRSPRKSPSNLNVVSAKERDSCALEEPNLSNSTKRRRHNKKNLRILFLR